MNKKEFVSPAIEVIEVEIEAGIAQTATNSPYEDGGSF